MSEKNSPSSRYRSKTKAASDNQKARLQYPFLWQTELSSEAILGVQESVLAAVSHSVTIADASVAGFPLIYVNEAFCAMTGYTPEEVLGKNCKFLQGVDTEESSVELLREALHKGERSSVVLKNYRKDGSPFWNEVTLTPVEDADGKVTHIVGVQNDVTRRVAAEENLAQTQKDLERTTLEMAQVTLELERSNAQHYHDARHDPLTGLANRHAFDEHLKHVLERSKRLKDKHFAVIYLDLDDFKTVNDSYGHNTGDTLLVAVAQRLKTCVRPSDTAARLGGDEFALLLEDLDDPAEASQVAERIKMALVEPFIVGEQSLTVAASIGVATQQSTHQDSSQVMRDADTAMYLMKAKRKS
jgi:diguanylate cyclase (GGDEF)-like protein/PAS domain S-box-containing protein